MKSTGNRFPIHLFFSVLLMQGAYALEPGGYGAQDEEQSPTFSCGENSVVLVVDPLVVDSVRASLDQFEADLCDDGYHTIENSAGFDNPAALRSYLQQLYGQTGIGLVGAILVGDIPHSYQWVELIFTNPDLTPLMEEVISFQYYSDLDGLFEKSPGYVSPSGHAYSFDVHSGEVDWELWVGVLPYYRGDLTVTVDALNRYFEKNHAFRTGTLRRPNVFLQISELLNDAEYLRSGPYVWAPFATADDARLYAGDVSGGYADLEAGVAKFTVVDAHGYWGASGQLSIDDVETNPVRTILFWSSGCAIGNLDYEENFLTSILYSYTSEVLIAKGTTNNSGGMGNNENGFYGKNIAEALSAGASFGDAVLGHVNVPLVSPWSNSREFHFATPVLLGDPTLKFELNKALEINSGLNDAWFNPATSGQGFLISVFPKIKQMFVAWFTYDIERPPGDVQAMLGEPGHRWLTAQGPYAGDTASLTIYITEGGVFDAIEPPASNDGIGDGIMTIEFADCTEGLVTYEITSPSLSGEIPIQRIVNDNVTLCETLSSQ
jgi:hypothetical protein